MRGISAYSAMGAAIMHPSSEANDEVLKDIGGALRDTRESYQLTTEQISYELHIAAHHLDAIERGEWSAIPGEVYARGYARRYADYLGFERDFVTSKLSTVPTLIDPIVTPTLQKRSTNINLKPFILIGVMALVGIGVGALLARMPKTAYESSVKPVPEDLSHYTDHLQPIAYARYRCLQETSTTPYPHAWSCYHYSASATSQQIITPTRLTSAHRYQDAVLWP